MWHIDENDRKQYEAAIDRALIDDEFFNDFKTSGYSKVVGMGENWQMDFFREKFKQSNLDPHCFNDVEKNDIYGGLEILPFCGLNLSVNTARYINTAEDLNKYFGPLNNKILTEIGIGYGGLCFICNSIFDLKQYHLIDLPKPQALAIKYLTKLGLDNFVCYPPEKSFLTISEFAISELSFDLVEEYNEKILKNSENLYLVINIHDHGRKKEFISIIEKYHTIQRFDEYPKTQWDNDVLVCKNRSNA